MLEFPTDAIFIGLDYGVSKIGVAVGQRLTGTASALAPIPNRRLVISWEHLDSLNAQWQPAAWVVGIPLQLDGGRSTVTRLARRFIAMLREHFLAQAARVFSADEKLTTQEAKRLIYRDYGGEGQGGGRALQRRSVDSVAAKLILEAWMQELSHHLASR